MEYMTTEEFCTRIGVSRETALRWFKSGDFPAVKIGGRWFVSKQEFAAKMNKEAKI